MLSGGNQNRWEYSWKISDPLPILHITIKFHQCHKILHLTKITLCVSDGTVYRKVHVCPGSYPMHLSVAILPHPYRSYPTAFPPLILFFFFLLAKYSQRHFIHKMILVCNKIAQIHITRRAKLLWLHCCAMVRLLCNGRICCTFSSHTRLLQAY